MGKSHRAWSTLRNFVQMATPSSHDAGGASSADADAASSPRPLERDGGGRRGGRAAKTPGFMVNEDTVNEGGGCFPKRIVSFFPAWCACCCLASFARNSTHPRGPALVPASSKLAGRPDPPICLSFARVHVCRSIAVLHMVRQRMGQRSGRPQGHDAHGRRRKGKRRKLPDWTESFIYSQR
jgi:hypothetical protein